MNNSEKLISSIANGRDLTFEESKKVFIDIMTGNVKEEIIYNFLVDLSAKGETSEEIAGGVYVLREKALKVKVMDGKKKYWPQDIIVWLLIKKTLVKI